MYIHLYERYKKTNKLRYLMCKCNKLSHGVWIHWYPNENVENMLNYVDGIRG
jgi:antitoxin component YwqK of YwqJK toxin-antitoxin module